jgi:tetratricopeptide (TPR) repeat protein
MQGWRSYVEARIAATTGAGDRAGRGYAAALAAQPGNSTIADQALRHAITAGDRDLAIAAARVLDRAQRMTPEAHFVLLADVLRRRDWRAADARIGAIATQQGFSFTAPVLRAWVALGSRRGDPLAILAAAGDQLPEGYAAEQRALILLAQGRSEGAQELTAIVQDHPRGVRLRIAAAAQLASRRRGDEALRLIEGEAEPLRIARAFIERRRPVPGAIATAEQGIAEFLIRLALELNAAQDLRPVAISMARIATFMAPESSTSWIVTAELLSLQERPNEALAALSQVRPEDPFAGTARNTRVRLLATAGRNQEALGEALALTQAQGASVEDWTRLGDIYSQLERYTEAAEAYQRAISLIGDGASGQGAWALWMLRGGALERGGNWPEGKAALQRAYQLAPTEPLVLNYLGYAQLERRENLPEAERLIREAHRLAPDDASITDSLGWALYVRGNFAEAIPLLERAAAAQPADVTINEHLGDAYYAAGRRSEARFAWRAAAVYAEGRVAERLRSKIDTGRLTAETAAP